MINFWEYDDFLIISWNLEKFIDFLRVSWNLVFFRDFRTRCLTQWLPGVRPGVWPSGYPVSGPVVTRCQTHWCTGVWPVFDPVVYRCCTQWCTGVVHPEQYHGDTTITRRQHHYPITRYPHPPPLPPLVHPAMAYTTLSGPAVVHQAPFGYNERQRKHAHFRTLFYW